MLQTDFPEYDPSIAKEYGSQGFSGPDFMGIPLFNDDALFQLLIRFGFNALICWLIIRYFYYRKGGRREFLFTFSLFAVTIFLLIFLLDSVKLQIGMALGLFAIFGIIRYRTEQVSIREMTYLFVIIGISVINGLAMTISISELIVSNAVFIGAIALMESNRFIKHTSTKAILYERIELIKPEKSAELKADLEARTGLEILKIEIGHIDFLRDVAFLKIYYHPKNNTPNSIDTITKLSDIS
ncbi:MAG TPA: DUF4956 domain-containing protein [Paludibacter sp.]|nr:DUF4956 domain-containing protein [Paludibacter sp.]